MMAVERVVLLLALASLLAVQAVNAQSSSSQTGSFVDWLASQSSTTAQTSSIDEEEPAATCLTTQNFGNCRCLNDACTRHYVETDLTCCSASTGEKTFTDYTELRATKAVIGGCSVTEEYFSSPVAREGDTTSLGTFSAVCDLKAESSLCSSSLVDGLTLTITGEIMGYSRIAFRGGVADVRASCSADTRSRSPLKNLLDRGAKKPDGKLVEPPAFAVGAGNIYVGNFQVVSSKKLVSFKTGRFEQVIATGDNFRSAATAPERSFVADDLAVKLNFF